MNEKKKYDIGIVGWWFASNYGSALTYYALGNILREKGLDPIMLSISLQNGHPWNPETKKTIEFIRKHFPISDTRPIENNPEYNDLCDMFLLGSDQLWNCHAISMLDYTFFLDFADNSKKKIAYATSFGNATFGGNDEQKKYIRQLLDSFDYISVREASGIEACKNSFGIDVKRDLDPVFLCDISKYDELADSCGELEPDENFVFSYILDVTEEKQKAVQYVAEKLGARVVSVLDMKTVAKQKSRWNTGKLNDDASIEEFMYYIKHCKMLVTDSHHGACFGMLYNKPLITISNASRGLTRFTHLFNLFNMNSRLFADVKDIYTSDRAFEPFDYSEFNAILAKEKKESFMRFFKALDAPRNEKKKMLPKSKRIVDYENEKLGIGTENVSTGVSADTKKRHVDIERCRMLASLLRDYKVRHVVLSSGTRHVELVRLFEANDCFITHPVLDERSAGFYALGLAAKLREPVAVCCTSGTASSNYLTSVSEAFYQKLPVIFITTDRYPHLLNQREDQMVPQENMYGGVSLKSVSIPTKEGHIHTSVARRMMCETILEATHRTPGPVHINLPIEFFNRKRLADEEYDLDKVHYTKIERHMLTPDREGWKTPVSRLEKNARVLLVYGQNGRLNADQQKALENFAKKTNCVVCTDHLSNARCSKSINAYNILKNPDSISPQMAAELKPDIVITVNGATVNNYRAFLWKVGHFNHWDITLSGAAADVYKKLSRIFECTGTQFFKRVNFMMQKTEGSNSYFEAWKKYEKKNDEIPSEYGQKYAVYHTLKKLPSGSMLHLANSNTIRMANCYEIDPSINVYCNRGTNGIDGSASSFMGQVAVSSELAFLMIGDLSFFYDMNSLWNKELKGNIRIMLFNNSGAGLLRDHSAQAITHKHDAFAEGWVKSLGFTYLSSRNKEEFEANIGRFTSTEDTPMFFEIFVD